MSANKFAQVRYSALDKCLRNRNNHFSIYELAKKCDEAIFKVDEKNDRRALTIRQIRYDLEFMESDAGFQAEIEKYKLPGDKKTYFRYENPDFSISQRPFSDKDAEKLREALMTLQRFEGLPHFDWIEEFAARVEDLNDLDEDKGIAISFEKNAYHEAQQWISPIYQAIISKSPLKVEYVPFDQEPEIHLISPYLLKQYNKRWFVLSRTDKVDYLTNLALDRIQGIEPSTHRYIPYPDEKPLEFFDDIIGVTNFVREEVQCITLEVEKSLWPYIKTKPIHDFQIPIKGTEGEDWVTLKLNIKTNYEFYSVVLSHGARIRIVSPQSVKNKMKSFIKEMSIHY